MCQSKLRQSKIKINGVREINQVVFSHTAPYHHAYTLCEKVLSHPLVAKLGEIDGVNTDIVLNRLLDSLCLAISRSYEQWSNVKYSIFITELSNLFEWDKDSYLSFRAFYKKIITQLFLLGDNTAKLLQMPYHEAFARLHEFLPFPYDRYDNEYFFDIAFALLHLLMVLSRHYGDI